jgi:DNA-binding transcriptional regulator YdaS (Cro superfamily)
MATKSLAKQKRAALERAVQAVGGNGAELARRLKKDPTIVATWFQRGQVSHKAVLDVEEVTGVPCYELRPDLYRKPEVRA